MPSNERRGRSPMTRALFSTCSANHSEPMLAGVSVIMSPSRSRLSSRLLSLQPKMPFDPFSERRRGLSTHVPFVVLRMLRGRLRGHAERAAERLLNLLEQVLLAKRDASVKLECELPPVGTRGPIDLKPALSVEEPSDVSEVHAAFLSNFAFSFAVRSSLKRLQTRGKRK